MKIYLIIMILFSIGMVGIRMALKKPLHRHFGSGLFVAFAMITFAEMTMHNTPLFLILCAGIFVLTVRDRVDALCRFALLAALVPKLSYDWSIGSAYITTVSATDALLLGLAIVLLLYRDRGGPVRRWDFRKEEFAILAIVLISIFGDTRDFGLTTTARSIVLYGWTLALPYYLFTRYTKNWQEFGQIAVAIGGAAFLLSIMALYEARFGWSLFDTSWRNLNLSDFMSRNMRIRGGVLRSPTTFNESTSFAVFQIFGIVAIAYCRRSFRSPLLWRGVFAMACLGLLVAQSRGASIALVAGFTITFLFQRKYGRLGAMAMVSLCGIGLLFAAAPSSPRIAAFLGVNKSYSIESDYRAALFKRGLEEGMKHPFFGTDIVKVRARLTDLTQGEHIVDFVNTYLTIFLTAGLVGLFAFLAPIGLIYAKAWPRPRGAMAEIDAMHFRNFAIGGLTAILVALLFTSFYERNPLWLMLAIAGMKAFSRGSQKVLSAQEDGASHEPSPPSQITATNQAFATLEAGAIRQG